MTIWKVYENFLIFFQVFVSSAFVIIVYIMLQFYTVDDKSFLYKV